MSKETLIESVANTFTLPDAQTGLLNALKRIREKNPDKKILYVIGTVTSDGPNKIEENLKLLRERSGGSKHESSIAKSAGITIQDYCEFISE